jgi:hypothetical protein
LWALLTEHFSHETEQLRPMYEQARAEAQQAASNRKRDPRERLPSQRALTPHLLGGPFVIERYDIVYVFRESRSPEEIIELRQVRALQKASGYGLKFTATEDPDFEQEPEALWGGCLTHEERYVDPDQTVYLRRLDFGRQLRRGEVHRFGLRYWVERTSQLSTHINIVMTRQTEVVGLHVNFWGSTKPATCWRYGPLPEESMAPGTPTSENSVAPNLNHCVSTDFNEPELGTHFGIAWRWP